MSGLANIPYLDRIWRAEGHVDLTETLAPAEAFDRLDPLFRTPGTDYAVEGDTLGYVKRNPAAQDKLATFTRGTLRVAPGAGGGTRLFFDVSSAALLLCFLAPLLFLGFAQLAETINTYERARAEATAKDKKDEAKDKPVPQLHWIDQMLGAPAPKDPKADKDKKKEPKEKIKTTPAYVLAGLFLAIYLVGRFLEPWLLKRTLRAALAAPADRRRAAPGGGGGGGGGGPGEAPSPLDRLSPRLAGPVPHVPAADLP